jgi:hypothetical protein
VRARGKSAGVGVWTAHSPLVGSVVIRYTWSRAVTTGPNTRVEVSVLGRLDMFLTTREPLSCFAGAPTSVWHRLCPSYPTTCPEAQWQSDGQQTLGLESP